MSQILQKDLLEAQTELGHCNILVIGKSGVGKSTLVNAVFRDELARTGVGSPVTRHIRQYSKPGCPITIYDTPGMELDGKLPDTRAMRRVRALSQSLAAPEDS